MACNNEADLNTMTSARSANDAVTTLSDRERATLERIQIANMLGFVQKNAHYLNGIEAITKAEEEGVSPRSGEERDAVGFVGEHVAMQHAMNNLGHVPLFSGEEKGRGIDNVTYDPATEKICIWEIKTSTKEESINHAPRMNARTNDGRQMSKDWINARLNDVGLDVAKASDIVAYTAKIDVNSHLGQIYEINVNTGEQTMVGGRFDTKDLY